MFSISKNLLDPRKVTVLEILESEPTQSLKNNLFLVLRLPMVSNRCLQISGTQIRNINVEPYYSGKGSHGQL